jgi:hypothetical protein
LSSERNSTLEAALFGIRESSHWEAVAAVRSEAAVEARATRAARRADIM